MQIVKTYDWRRIDALPRRDWENQAQYYADAWTEVLKRPDGKMRLRAVQGALIQEAVELGGAVGAIAVGAGKSVLSLLLPVAMRSNNPLLIVPASLKQQTIIEVIPNLKKHWFIKPIEIVSYDWISSLNGQNFLEEYQPDLIILDESHKLKNLKTARTRRFLRYFRIHSDTKCVALSGTLTKDSLLDYYHLLHICLRDNAPIPSNYKEVEKWDLCLSPKADSWTYRKIKPGALQDWDTLNPRKGYLNRLRQSPGIICTSDSAIGTSLIIRKRKALISIRMKEALDRLETRWELPNGQELWDILEYHRYTKQISLGYYYLPIEEAPRDWTIARRDWNAWARKYLRNNRKGIDTPAALEEAIKEFPPIEYIKWIQIKNNYTPEKIAHWYDNTILHQIYNSIENPNTLLWTDSIAIGKHVDTFAPYFGAGQELIKTYDTGYPDKPNIEAIRDGTICLSIGAHGEGKNLQSWAYNYIITCPSSGKTWEQLIGRTHRPGQEADEVIVDVLCHTSYQERSFNKAISEAKYIQETTGQQQKLLLGRIIDYE